MWRYVISYLIGYVLGSFLPAWVVGRIHGDNIFEKGTGNPGTANTYHLYGPFWASLVAIYDVSKGVLAIIIARYIFGLNWLESYIAGLMAFVGHIASVFFRFRGGQGAACLTGIMFLTITKLIQNEPSTIITPFKWLLLWLVIIAIFSFTVARIEEVVALVNVPLLFVSLVVSYGFLKIPEVFILEIIFVYSFLLSLRNFITQKIYERAIKDIKTFKSWRYLLRPLAILFIPFHYWFGKNINLVILAIVFGIFGLIDVVRLVYNKFNVTLLEKLPQFLKKKEERRFSSITLFLLSSFVVYLIFKEIIFFITLAILTYGDFYAKFFGLNFGKRKIFEKTLEGSLAYAIFSIFFVSLVIIATGNFNTHTVLLPLIGILSAVIEALPLGVDDNISVGILTAGVLHYLI